MLTTSRHGWGARAALCALIVAVMAGAVAAPAEARPRAVRTYIAIGDSVTSMTQPESFAPRFYGYLRRAAHANHLVVLPALLSRDVAGPGGALDRAVREIKRRSDVVAVTLTTGGNDALNGACWTAPECPYPATLDSILRRLRGALLRDPGRERLELLAYYNPRDARVPDDQALADRVLLGSDLRIDCSGTGAQIGLDDDIACIGWRDGWIVVDAWPWFRSGGTAFLPPGNVHPTDAGNALLALLFRTACSLPAAAPGVPDPDGFLAARPLNGGSGCVGFT